MFAKLAAAKDSAVLQVLGVCWPLLLGNILEWYDFSIYGFLEAHMRNNFFQGSAIATWLGFATTFLARPLGGLFLGLISDVFGRKVSTVISIVGMVLATAGQGLLPTYQNGTAAGNLGLVLLIFLRLLQGLFAGGEVGGIVAYMTESIPKKSLGTCFALVSISVNLGFLFAKIVAFIFQTSLTSDQIDVWGWRIPFLLAVIPGLLGLFGRRRLPESQSFILNTIDRSDTTENDNSSIDKSSNTNQQFVDCSNQFCSILFLLFKQNYVALALGIGLSCCQAVVQYCGLLWTDSFLRMEGVQEEILLIAAVLNRSVSMILAFPLGWLTDYKGVAWVTLIGSVIVAVSGVPLFVILSAELLDPSRVLLIFGLGFGFVYSWALGSIQLHFAELFPTSVRSVGIGISWNLGMVFFGGFSPTLAQESLAWAFWAPGLIFALSGAVTASTVLISLQLQKRGHLVLAHVRPFPYFGSEATMASAPHDGDGPTV